MVVVIIALLIIVGIFGVASMMQSQATVQQAQAQIEVAKVAQVNAWGNLVTILTLTLVIVVVVAAIAAVVWVMWKRSAVSGQRSAGNRQVASRETPLLDPNQALGQLVQLETLRMLKSMQDSAPQLTAPKEESQIDDPFPWLR